MTLQRIAVVGCGTMGRGIAETAAVSGLAVTVVEPSTAQRAVAQTAWQTSVAKGIAKGRIGAANVDEVLARIVWADSIADIGPVPFIIEAVSEDESIKTGIFTQLDQTQPPETILASNTSSISISKLGATTARPAQVVGMHFFNPVPIMAPVEIVRGTGTSEQSLAATHALATQMGKQAFVVNDRGGFVVNRVLMPMINEAAYALQDNVADASTIDSLMRLGCNHPMGPLALADLVGLDVCLAILQTLQKEIDAEKFTPCPLLVSLVSAGKLGRKTGTGFYSYTVQK